MEMVAALLIKALGSNWEVLSEEVGLWIPTEVIHMEHSDKPKGEEEIGKSFPPIFHSFHWLLQLLAQSHNSLLVSKCSLELWDCHNLSKLLLPVNYWMEVAYVPIT